MRRLALFVLSGLLGVVSSTLAYDGPALQTSDHTLSNIRVVMTTPSQVAVDGQTPLTLTAFVPVDADSVGLAVDMEIRKATGLGTSLLARCSYETQAAQLGQVIVIPCHRLSALSYSALEGAVSIYAYVVRHSRSPATEWVHDGFAHRVPVAMVIDDSFEENDSFADARLLGSAATHYQTDLLSLDADYYRFVVPPGFQTTKIALDFARADLDLYVYNAAREVVAVSDGYSNRELVWFAVQPGAEYFVRVARFSGTPAFYELRLTQGTTASVTLVSGPAGAPTPVSSGGAVDVAADAYDWNGHPPQFSWAASCPALPNNGTFVDPSRNTTRWQAPTNTTGLAQICTITVVVSNGQGSTDTGSYLQVVDADSDIITILFGPGGSPNPVTGGLPAQLEVIGSDSAGHPLMYEWSDACAFNGQGSFWPDRFAHQPLWFPPANPFGSPATCTLTVRIIDAFNHSTIGTTVIGLAPADVVTITSGPTPTPNAVASGGVLTLTAGAADSLGHGLTYSWQSMCSSGPHGTFVDDTVQNPTWTAPTNMTGMAITCAVTVTATDPGSNFGSKSVIVVVNSVPDIVTITGGPTAAPATVPSQGLVAFSVTAADSLGHAPLLFTWTAACPTLPTNGVFQPNANTDAPGWIAPVNTTGVSHSCTVVVVVSDAIGHFDTRPALVIEVQSAPDGVTILSGPIGSPQPVASRGPVAIALLASDAFGHTLTFNWTASLCTGGLGSGTFLPGNAVALPTWQAPFNITGAQQSCTITAVVDDGVGNTDTGSFVQLIDPEPHAITVTSGPGGNTNPVASGGTAAVSVAATDPAHASLSYLWQALCLWSVPDHGTFSPSAAAASVLWQAPPNDTGVPQFCTMTVTVDDGALPVVLASYQQWVNTEAEEEQPPAHDILITLGPSGSPNPVASQGSVVVNLQASDTFNHNLTFLWVPVCPQLPTTGSFTPSASHPTPVWTAPENRTGLPRDCVLTVTIDDGQGTTVTAALTISVNSSPDSVTITSGPSATPELAASGGTVALAVVAADSLSHALGYQWHSSCLTLTTHGAFAPSSTAMSPTWTAPINETGSPHRCTLTVTADDSRGNTATRQVTVHVNSVPNEIAQIITITAGPGGVLNPVVSGGVVGVFVAAVDTLGRPLTYTWSSSCPGLGAHGTFGDLHAASTTWTAPVNITGQAQTCALAVAVTDDLGHSVTVSYQQIVGTPPVIVISTGVGSGGNVGPGGGIVIGVQGPSLPGQTLTYQWTSICPSLPSHGIFVTPTSATSGWTAPVNQTGVPQSCMLTVTIHDGQGQVQTASFTVIVDPLCLYTVNPTAVTIAAAGGSALFTVTTDPGCGWAALPDAPWVQFAGTPGGTGNGTFTVALAPTTALGTRTAQLNVGGRSVEVHQTGKGYTYFLAEGATINHFFETRIALLNFGTTDTANVSIDFQLKDTSTVLTHTLSLGPHQRGTVEVRKLAAAVTALAALDSAEFSTVVRSNAPLVVDRTMTWDDRGYGGHTETAIDAPSSVWYLAEGATIGEFELYYLIQNPNNEPLDNEIEVTYLLPAPAAPIVRRYSMGAHTRRNIAVHLEPGLENVEVSAIIRTPNGKPVIVERAMYLSTGDLFYGAGHESTGIRRPEPQWFFAEGATGGFFDLFVLLGNPQDQAAHVTATYLFDDGSTCSMPVGNALQAGVPVLAPKSRHNIWVDLEVVPSCPRSLADVAVSTLITADLPIIAERAMWWPGQSGTWAEAHNSAGATESGVKWGIADGEQGLAASVETYVLVANTSGYAGIARVTLYFEDGTSIDKVVELLPSSRTNVPIGVAHDEARATAGLAERGGFGFGTEPLNRRFGVVVESLPVAGQPGPAQIVVERSSYWNGPGAAFWAAGTNALASKLR